MIERVDELKTQPVIGKYYLVPCAVSPHWSKSVPVLGPAHSDADRLAFKLDHWHYDVRFWGFIDLQSAYPIAIRTRRPDDLSLIARWYMSHVIAVHDSSVAYKRRKCYRAMPDLQEPESATSRLIIQKLRADFSTQNLNCGKCPHRGIDLSSMPSDNGLIKCPGHGLIWDAKTGGAVSLKDAEQRCRELSK